RPSAWFKFLQHMLLRQIWFVKLVAFVCRTNGTSLRRPAFHNSLRFSELHQETPCRFNLLKKQRLRQICFLKLVPFVCRTEARRVLVGTLQAKCPAGA